MTALVQALSRLSTPSSPEVDTLRALAIFCSTGFLVSLIFAACGLDLNPEPF
jgi:hypothetical protein